MNNTENEQQKYFVCLQKEFLEKAWENKYYTDIVAVAYGFRYYSSIRKNFPISVYNLYKYVGNEKNKRKEIIKITESLYNLGIKEVDIYDTYCIEAPYPSSNFVMIHDENMDKIFKSDTKMDKYKLFSVYCYLMKCVGNNYELDNYKICSPGMKTIATVTGISRSFVEKAIPELERLEVILVARSGLYTRKGEVKNGKNFYSRYDKQEKDTLIKWLNEEARKEHEVKITTGWKVVTEIPTVENIETM